MRGCRAQELVVSFPITYFHSEESKAKETDIRACFGFKHSSTQKVLTAFYVQAI